MHIGYQSMNTLQDQTPAKLALALEERGYESFWVGEHPHIPCSRQTPYPAGGEMPDRYRRMMDPFVSLAVAAAATTRLRVGTSVALPLEHDLFDLAKSVSTLDRLADGRVLFGVGVGWNQEELANCRTFPWSERYRALGECVAALKALWSADAAEFHGAYYDFDPVWSDPKPVQQPHPPLLCGMAGRLGTKQTVAWADEWMPLDIGLGDVAKKLRLFREATAAAGRNEIPVTIVAWGDPTWDTLVEYRDLGVERVVVGVARRDAENPETVYSTLDQYAELIPRLT